MVRITKMNETKWILDEPIDDKTPVLTPTTHNDPISERQKISDRIKAVKTYISTYTLSTRTTLNFMRAIQH